MRIFVTGQCSLHWGRLEYGNIGNYYVTETTFRELHRVFPNAEIVTTFQMTEEFQEREKVTVVPMELFYGWKKDDLDIALKEFGIAQIYTKTGELVSTTPYIEEVRKSDLIIDFSGDMWGANADLQGKNRFLVGLFKDKTAQLLKKCTVMIGATPGPFSKSEYLSLIRETFFAFNKVFLREPRSNEILTNQYNIVSNNVESTDCQSFIFEGDSDNSIDQIIKRDKIIQKGRINVGVVLCGFNFIEGPYNKPLWRDEEFVTFAQMVEYMVVKKHFRVVLMSHSNGFEIPPKEFKLLNGRDYYIQEQLYNVLQKRNLINMEDVILLNQPYLPKQIFSIIKHFDMFVSGRLHGSVAALSQGVPTTVINYANGPNAHKLSGYMKGLEAEQYLAFPDSIQDLINKIDLCWNNKESYRQHLNKLIPIIQENVHHHFDELPLIFENFNNN